MQVNECFSTRIKGRIGSSGMMARRTKGVIDVRHANDLREFRNVLVFHSERIARASITFMMEQGDLRGYMEKFLLVIHIPLLA
jgi:hypothetical protein